MDFSERAIWLAIGMVIGWFAGEIVRRLREIKRELDEVEEIVKHHDDIPHQRDERGVFQMSWSWMIVLALVVGLTAYAAFASQKATNQIKKQNEVIAAQGDFTRAVSNCNQVYLSKVIKALNERTTYAKGRDQSQIELFKTQYELFTTLLHQPPYDAETVTLSAKEYQERLRAYLAFATLSADKVANNSYPKDAELAGCLSIALASSKENASAE